MELQINQFWILKVYGMINSANQYEPDVLNTSCATRAWKLKILQRMCELISSFATQRFCSFWKTISPWILDRKSQIFQHVFNFTSTLTSWSQFISNIFPSASKAVCKWQKCKQWRQQGFPYKQRAVCIMMYGVIRKSCQQNRLFLPSGLIIYSNGFTLFLWDYNWISRNESSIFVQKMAGYCRRV